MFGLGSFFIMLYFAAVIGVTIFVLVLLNRFVTAQDRLATAVEEIARHQRRESR